MLPLLALLTLVVAGGLCLSADPSEILPGKLLSPDLSTDGRFGSAVGVFEGSMVIGSEFAGPGGGNGAGRAWIFERTLDENQVPGPYVLLQELSAMPLVWVQARFGMSASMWGETVAVSAVWETSGGQAKAGVVFIYNKRPEGLWGQDQVLAAPTPRVDGEFGFSLCAQGNLVAVAEAGVVGASLGYGGQVHLYERPEAGAPYTYLTTVVPQGPTPGSEEWSFGSAVALWGDTLLVAAWGEPSLANPIYNGNFHLYRRPAQQDGETWEDLTSAIELTHHANEPANAGNRDSVAFVGPHRFVLGRSPRERMYSYVKVQNQWHFHQEIVPPQGSVIKFATGVRGGGAMLAVVSAIGDVQPALGSGAAWVFQLEGGKADPEEPDWHSPEDAPLFRLVTSLAARDRTDGDALGHTLDVDRSSGQTLVFGVHLDDIVNEDDVLMTNAGSAYVMSGVVCGDGLVYVHNSSWFDNPAGPYDPEGEVCDDGGLGRWCRTTCDATRVPLFIIVPIVLLGVGLGCAGALVAMQVSQRKREAASGMRKLESEPSKHRFRSDSLTRVARPSRNNALFDDGMSTGTGASLVDSVDLKSDPETWTLGLGSGSSPASPRRSSSPNKKRGPRKKSPGAGSRKR